MLIRPAWRFLPCSQIRPQMWQLGKQKGGRHAQEGGAHGGPIVRKFQTKSATTKCVISSAAKHKSSTKLHTIWSHVLDRSAKVLNKLIIPLSVLHTFFHYRRWRAGKVQCPAVCQLLAKWKIPPAIGAKCALACSHHWLAACSLDLKDLCAGRPQGRLDTSTDPGR